MTKPSDHREAIARLTGFDLTQPLGALVDDGRAVRALRHAGIETLFDFLRTPRAELLRRPGVGPRVWERACAALESRLRGTGEVAAQSEPGIDAEAAGFVAILRRVREALDENARRLLDAVLGIGRRAQSAESAAIVLRLARTELSTCLATLREALDTHASGLLARFVDEAQRELEVHDGVIGIDDLATGSSLREAARRAPEPALPLRLLAFWQPDAFTMDGDHLCGVSAEGLRQLVRGARQALTALPSPIRVADLERAAGLDPKRHALLLHVLQRVLAVAIVVHPELGETIGRSRRSLPGRIELILEDNDGPLGLDDLLFRHRDRFGGVRRARLRTALRSHGSFLELGPELWSLRARHLDELELLRPEAERLAAEIVAVDARVSLRERMRAGELSERSAWLLADLLRRERSVRALGRGEFSPRRRGLPPLIRSIADELRRAMGEVPFARFLQNQPAGRRRLVSRLLRANRLFVSPSRDRVDLLENWPFDAARLNLLLRSVAIALEERGGYAAVSRLRPTLAEAGFDQGFLTDHLLLDLLRRHGDFELLQGGFVAVRGVGLARWILRTARRILRAHVSGLSLAQLLAERPELAEFEGCLAALLQHDPLVQSADGLRFQVV